MPKPFRLLSVFLAAFVVVALATPAGAADSYAKRAAARAHRAQVAAKLNTLKATDAQLLAAIRVLDGQVSAQSAAAQAAKAAEADAAARLAATEKQIVELHGQVVSRAVDVYKHPRTGVETVSNPADINEASRRAQLLASVNGKNADALDRLRMIRQDLTTQREVLGKLKQDAQAKLDSLNQARLGQARLAKALAARIADSEAEAAAASAAESSISALIKQQEAARASRGGASFGDGRISGAGLIWPIRGTVTSGFGYRWGRMHQGIDIGVPVGTPIHAAKAGQVIFAGTMSGYGYVIIVDHGGGFSTLYAHQSRLGSGQGQSVSQGQVIGYSGNTGHSTGPHLHFETRVNGNPENPMRYLP